MLRLMENGLLDHKEKTYISSIDNKCNLNAAGSKGTALNKPNNIILTVKYV